MVVADVLSRMVPHPGMPSSASSGQCQLGQHGEDMLWSLGAFSQVQRGANPNSSSPVQHDRVDLAAPQPFTYICSAIFENSSSTHGPPWLEEDLDHAAHPVFLASHASNSLGHTQGLLRPASLSITPTLPVG